MGNNFYYRLGIKQISSYAFNLYIPTPYTKKPTPLSTNLISNLDTLQLIKPKLFPVLIANFTLPRVEDASGEGGAREERTKDPCDSPFLLKYTVILIEGDPHLC